MLLKIVNLFDLMRSPLLSTFQQCFSIKKSLENAPKTILFQPPTINILEC